MTDLDATKIVYPDLREFAETSAPSTRRSVIIELGGPPPKVTLRKPSRTSPHFGSGQAEILDFGDDPGRAEAMDRLEEELSKLRLSERPVRLDSAEAFVASVTPEQLRALTRLSLVGAVRPNREHHTPPRRFGT
jgi:hypothetical protein